MKQTISDRIRYCLISLIIMLFFVLMFPPVMYKKIGLMYGYSGFDDGELLWTQLLIEIFVVAIISVFVYLLYPKYTNWKR
ncbi:MAG: hypothetical protein P4L27_04875 [Ignavibacteriaceae bacterium]|nr:hypothetical protein [Ignavibacteriaceae bacterium]